MLKKFMLASAGSLAMALVGPAMANQGDAEEGAATLSAPKIEYTRWTLDNGLQVCESLPNRSDPKPGIPSCPPRPNPGRRLG